MTPALHTSRKSTILGMCIISLLAGGYLGWHYNQGWIAHDEGLLGHTAELTMLGQTPHVEFQDVYTGLLSHINAVSFKIFGISLASLRIPLLFGAIITSMVWYLIALRLVNPLFAGIVAVTSTVWSFPNYFAALPSWYLLMLASWTAWALIKFHETTSRRYILLAAVLSGLAILFKIVGLYLVAASLFSIWISDLDNNRKQTENTKQQTHPVAKSYPRLISFGLAGIFTLLVVLLIKKHLSFSTSVYFLIPVAASMATMLEVSKEIRIHFKDTVMNCLIFSAVLCLPILVFIFPYMLKGHVADITNGLFDLPKARLDHAAALPPNGLWSLVAVPVVGLTIVENKISRSMILPLTATIALGGACLCILATNTLIYQSAFAGVQCSLPAISMGAWYCSRKYDLAMPVVILTLVSGCLSITQYPYSSGVYFCYCAPLVILTLTGLIGRVSSYDKPLWLTFLMLLAAFSVIYINYSNPRLIGVSSQRLENNKSLQTTRAKLQIESILQKEYNLLLQIINEHTTTTDFILAGPDCPQFYFLSGRQNPTSQCYDLFRAYQLGGQSQLETELKTLIGEKDIDLFIQNQLPEFSLPYSHEFIGWLESWGDRSPTIGSGRFQIFIRKNK
ncbi:MAG: hypothetical protein CMJ76_12585 [Planctomycetaceae bacterium]|nr:hypothetical protein [Planctomycetaceae bacterium]